jgi:hypothetical protein
MLSAVQLARTSRLKQLEVRDAAADSDFGSPATSCNATEESCDPVAGRISQRHGIRHLSALGSAS